MTRNARRGCAFERRTGDSLAANHGAVRDASAPNASSSVVDPVDEKLA
jgi:hypothetical protein